MPSEEKTVGAEQATLEQQLLAGQPPGTVIKCVTAQVIQTPQGPRIVLQGLHGAEFTPQQLAVVQQQVKQQLLKGTVCRPLAYVAQSTWRISVCRVCLKPDGTQWCMGREVKGIWQMEWVASTLTLPRNVVYAALLPLMCTPRLPVVDKTDAPADLNGLIRFNERLNLVSARVPSHFKHSLPSSVASFVHSKWML